MIICVMGICLSGCAAQGASDEQPGAAETTAIEDTVDSLTMYGKVKSIVGNEVTLLVANAPQAQAGGSRRGERDLSASDNGEEDVLPGADAAIPADGANIAPPDSAAFIQRGSVPEGFDPSAMTDEQRQQMRAAMGGGGFPGGARPSGAAYGSGGSGGSGSGSSGVGASSLEYTDETYTLLIPAKAPVYSRNGNQSDYNSLTGGSVIYVTYFVRDDGSYAVQSVNIIG